MEVRTCCDPAGATDDSHGVRSNGLLVLKAHGLVPRYEKNSNSPDVRLAMIERCAGHMWRRGRRPMTLFCWPALPNATAFSARHWRRARSGTYDETTARVRRTTGETGEKTWRPPVPAALTSSLGNCRRVCYASRTSPHGGIGAFAYALSPRPFPHKAKAHQFTKKYS